MNIRRPETPSVPLSHPKLTNFVSEDCFLSSITSTGCVGCFHIADDAPHLPLRLSRRHADVIFHNQSFLKRLAQSARHLFCFREHEHAARALVESVHAVQPFVLVVSRAAERRQRARLELGETTVPSVYSPRSGRRSRTERRVRRLRKRSQEREPASKLVAAEVSKPNPTPRAIDARKSASSWMAKDSRARAPPSTIDSRSVECGGRKWPRK